MLDDVFSTVFSTGSQKKWEPGNRLGTGEPAPAVGLPMIPKVPKEKKSSENFDGLKKKSFHLWRLKHNGRTFTLHMTPPHTLDEMRHIYRGAELVEPITE